MPLSWVEIDLAALRHNYSRAVERTAPGTSTLGVVKSDAYGHGMIPVARELIACGVKFLAVSKFWEAMELREAGIDLPVLALLGVEPCDMEEAIRMGIRPVIFRLDHARLLGETALRLDMPARVHVKVDTGMGRLGVPCDSALPFFKELTSIPGIILEGVLSHFACADEADKSSCRSQLGRFQEVLQDLGTHGHDFAYAHIANSAGILDVPHAHFHLVRPGIMLYGAPPSDELSSPTDLRPVMSLKCRILQVKDVPEGRPIGYGGTFVTKRPSRIATIPIGYDDGYPRLLSSRGHALVRGKHAPIVGRVSMNMITLDVTDMPGVAEDDEVVMLGSQGDERITGEEIAKMCGTISYEIFCNIGRHRFKRFLNSTV